MSQITLEQINRNIVELKKEIDEIREMMEESNFQLKDNIKKKIDKSRKRPTSKFKTQEQIEKKFL